MTAPNRFLRSARPFVAALLSAILAFGPAAAFADGPPIVFDEGNFSDSAFTFSVGDQTIGASASSLRKESGGSPDACRSIVHSVPPSGDVSTSFLSTGGSYDPKTSGAIRGITYREDRILVDPPSSTSKMESRLLLEQGGTLYRGPYVQFSADGWKTIEKPCLKASDFSDPAGGDAHPDFTSSGGVIRFGFRRGQPYDAFASGTSVYRHGIDNWRVVVFRSASGCSGEPAKVELTKTDDDATWGDDSRIVYKLRVKNRGGTGITGLSIREKVPEKTKFSRDGSTDVWSCEAGALPGMTCLTTTFDLAPGQEREFLFALTVDAGTPDTWDVWNVADVGVRSTECTQHRRCGGLCLCIAMLVPLFVNGDTSYYTVCDEKFVPLSTPPAAPSLREAALPAATETNFDYQTLYRFRDDVLAKSPGGRMATDLYYRHGGAMARLALADLSFARKLFALGVYWQSYARALVDGTGDTTRIDARDVSRLTEVLDVFAASNEPELAADVVRLRSELGVSGWPGKTASELLRRADAVACAESVSAPCIASRAETLAIPASAKAPGAAGTDWVSGLVLHNPGSADVTAELAFLEAGKNPDEGPVRSVTVPAGRSVGLDDVVGTTFGRSGTAGSILVGSAAPLIASSRTYNRSASGTYGQFIPGFPASERSTGFTAVRLSQLTESSAYRTNVGAVNLTDRPLPYAIDYRRADGSTIGTVARTLAPFEYRQEGKPIAALDPAGAADAYAILRAEAPPSSFLAYASVVDNRSGDPIYVPAAEAGNGPLVVGAAAHAAGANGTLWRTDVEVVNAGDGELSYALELLRRDTDSTSPQRMTFTIPAGGARRHADVLDSVFGISGSAAIAIRPSSGSLVATSRTFNESGDRTYGQFIPAIAETDAIAAGRTAYLVGLAGSADAATGFRTNSGLVNLATVPIDVVLSTYAADGTPLGERPASLPPRSFRQENDLLGGRTVSPAFATVRSDTPGASFLAWASVVDNASGDPIFIPAREVAEGATAASCVEAMPR